MFENSSVMVLKANTKEDEVLKIEVDAETQNIIIDSMKKSFDDFERMFVDEVILELQKRNMNHLTFGNSFFGEDGGRIWRRIRDPLSQGKPRRLTMGEAYGISTFLGIPYPDLVWRVCKKYEEKENKE